MLLIVVNRFMVSPCFLDRRKNSPSFIFMPVYWQDPALSFCPSYSPVQILKWPTPRCWKPHTVPIPLPVLLPARSSSCSCAQHRHCRLRPTQPSHGFSREKFWSVVWKALTARQELHMQLYFCSSLIYNAGKQKRHYFFLLVKHFSITHF